jgi:hypothetical protein
MQIFSLIKKGFEDNDLVTRFDKAHKSTEHAWTSGQREVQLCIHMLPMVHPPSFAPVVIETSVSGFNFLPKKGE